MMQETLTPGRVPEVSHCHHYHPQIPSIQNGAEKHGKRLLRG